MLEQPTYSQPELVADAAIHVLGLIAVAVGVILLWHVVTPAPTSLVAVALYMFGLVATFGFSAAYNLAPRGELKGHLRRLDHAAIFVMIAGTCTPLALLAVGGASGLALFIVVWIGAICGVFMKIVFPGHYERAAMAAYVLLGWSSLLALFPIMNALVFRDIALLAAGGVLYSAGALVHLARRLRYHNAIWHALVVCAASCHYLVILRLAMH